MRVGMGSISSSEQKAQTGKHQETSKGKGVDTVIQIKQRSRQMRRCSCLCQQSSALKAARRFGTAEESFLVCAEADLHRAVSASI